MIINILKSIINISRTKKYQNIFFKDFFNNFILLSKKKIVMFLNLKSKKKYLSLQNKKCKKKEYYQSLNKYKSKTKIMKDNYLN